MKPTYEEKEASVATMKPTYEEKEAAVRYENDWSWKCPCPPEDIQDDHNFIAWIDNHGEWIYLG